MTWNFTRTGFLIAVTISIYTLYAQQLSAYSQNIDSLVNVISSLPEDKNKVDFINQHCPAIMDYDYELALSLATEAKEMAEAFDYSYGEALSLENIGVYYWYNGYYDRANGLFNQAISKGINAEDHRLIADSYNRIGLMFYYQALYDSAEYYHQKALEHFRHMPDSLGIAMIWYHTGLLYFHQSKYETAVDYYLKALEIYESNGKPLNQAKMLNRLSEVYQQLGQTELIWENREELVELANREANQKNRALLNEQIGDIFFLTNSYDSALIYFEKAMTQFMQIGHLNRYDFVTEKVGKIHLSRGEHEKALEYLKEVYEIRYENGTRIHKVSAEGNMADIHYAMNDFQVALNYYLKVLQMNLEMGNAISTTRAYESVAKTYYQLEDYDQAILHASDGLERSRKISAYNTELSFLNILSDSYFQKEDYKTANTYLNAFHEKKEALERGKTLQRINRLQVQYNDEKNEREIAQLKQREILQTSEIQKQNLLITIVFILFLLILSVAIILYNRYQLKSKNNEILSLKNQQIERDNQTLNRKNKEGELLLAEIRHRIKNNLQTISSLLNMHSRMLSTQQQSLIQQSHDRVRAMALIHQKLNRNTNYAVIDLKSYLKELLDNLVISYGYSHLKTSFNIDHLPVEADIAVHIGLIANELISNALKHAFHGVEKPMIEVSAKRIDDFDICLVVRDNGKGFSGEYNKAGSFGIKLISVLIGELEGDLSFENKNGTKVKVTMKCPLKQIHLTQLQKQAI